MEQQRIEKTHNKVVEDGYEASGNKLPVEGSNDGTYQGWTLAISFPFLVPDPVSEEEEEGEEVSEMSMAPAAQFPTQITNYRSSRFVNTSERSSGSGAYKSSKVRGRWEEIAKMSLSHQKEIADKKEAPTRTFSFKFTVIFPPQPLTVFPH